MKKAASVLLRADINEKDANCLLDWLNDPETTQFLVDGKNSVSDVRYLINNIPKHLWRMCLNGRGCFYMVDCDDMPIGFVRLSVINKETYEVVIALGEKKLWGKGYGTLALKKCLNIAFFEHRVRRIIANIYPQNTRSLHVFEKLNFRQQEKCSSVIRYALTYDQFIA